MPGITFKSKRYDTFLKVAWCVTPSPKCDASIYDVTVPGTLSRVGVEVREQLLVLLGSKGHSKHDRFWTNTSNDRFDGV